MTLAVRTMSPGAAFLGRRLSAFALPRQSGSVIFHSVFPGLRSGSQPSRSLVSRINIPRTAPQSATQSSCPKSGSQLSRVLLPRISIPRNIPQSSMQFRFFSSQKDRPGSALQFPDKDTITQYLRNCKSLNLDYYLEKGITEAVTKLAAERFADEEIDEMAVKVGVTLLIYDLRTGEAGKSLLKLGKPGLPSIVWDQISTVTVMALKGCANSAKV